MNALKKINARAKQLKKLHPDKKYKTLQKQAGAEFKSGKLKAKRKKVGKVAKIVKRKPAARKHKPRTRVITKTVYKVRRVKVKAKRRAGVGNTVGKSSSLMPVIAIAAVAAAALYFMNRPAPQQMQYYPTGNVARDNTAANVIAYATAAGLTISAIAKLIESLNSSSDAQVAAAGASPAAYVSTFNPMGIGI